MNPFSVGTNKYPLEHLALPQSNYREKAEFDENYLLELGEDIEENGLQQAVGVAIFPDGQAKFCYGHMRLKAIETLSKIREQEGKVLSENLQFVETKVFIVQNDEEFSSIQIRENEKRKETDEVSKGKEFARLVKQGIPVGKIVKMITFPNGIVKMEARVNWVNDLIKLADCHPSVHLAYRAGYLATFKSGESQATMFAKYPLGAQEAVAIEILSNVKKKLSNENLFRLFENFTESFSNAHFDTENIVKGGLERACVSCNYFIQPVDQYKSPVCINAACFKSKQEEYYKAERLKAEEWCKEIGQEKPFRLVQNSDWYYGEKKEGEVYHYLASEKGKSSFVKVGIIDPRHGKQGLGDNKEGQAIWFVKANDPCPIHFPNKIKEREDKRVEKLDKMKSTEAQKLVRDAALKAVFNLEPRNVSLSVSKERLNLMEYEKLRLLFNSQNRLAAEKLCESFGLKMYSISYSTYKFYEELNTALKGNQFRKEYSFEEFVKLANTYFTLVNMADSPFVKNNKEDLELCLGVSFNNYIDVAKSNIARKEGKMLEDKSKEEERIGKIKDLISEIGDKIDWSNIESIENYCASEKERKKLARTLSVNIRDCSDNAQIDIVANRIFSKYNELFGEPIARVTKKSWQLDEDDNKFDDEYPFDDDDDDDDDDDEYLEDGEEGDDSDE